MWCHLSFQLLQFQKSIFEMSLSFLLFKHQKSVFVIWAFHFDCSFKITFSGHWFFFATRTLKFWVNAVYMHLPEVTGECFFEVFYGLCCLSGSNLAQRLFRCRINVFSLSAVLVLQSYKIKYITIILLYTSFKVQ